jgi:hypothetical protein
VAEESFHQRPRKFGNVDYRYKTSAFNPPERGLRKVFSPEDLPPSDRSPVHFEEIGKFADTAWRGPLPHRGDQDDHGAKVHLSAQKPYRWRSHSLSAPILVAAEAEPLPKSLGQIPRAAPRFSPKVTAVQSTTACATILARLFREILVQRKQKQPKLRIAKQSMVHNCVLQSFC